MARQERKQHPGDAANAFIRVLLSDAGAILGGLSDEQWQKTVDHFEGRCAYTSDPIVDGQMERDHAIPLNRTHCGLHLYGNVLPTSREANRRKGGKHYRQFVEVPERLGRIEGFIRDSGYWDRVRVLGDLQRYCEAQYRMISALCEVNKDYLTGLLPEELEEDEGRDLRIADSPLPTGGGKALPIVLEPPLAEDFRRALLREKLAWIVEIYRDGRQEVRCWNAQKLSETSNIIGNLRSRPRYRPGVWEREGIKSLRVSIAEP